MLMSVEGAKEFKRWWESFIRKDVNMGTFPQKDHWTIKNIAQMAFAKGLRANIPRLGLKRKPPKK